MTHRTLVFLWRNPAMTPAQFQEHYDTKHLPLVRKLVGEANYPTQHIRNYTTGDGAAVVRRGVGLDATSDHEDPLSYDVAVQMEFRDKQHWLDFAHAALVVEGNKEAIEEDELSFLRRDKTTVLQVTSQSTV